MKLAISSLNYRFNVGIIFACVLLFSFYAFKFIKKDLFPEVTPPVIVLTIPYLGASAEEVENLISKELEPSLFNLKDLKSLSLRSYQDVFVGLLEFNSGTSLHDRYIDLKELLDDHKKDLPEKVEEPRFEKLDFAENPFAKITVYSNDNLSEKDLYYYTKKIQNHLLQSRKFGTIEYLGKKSPELSIYVELDKLEKYQISIQELYQFLKGTFLKESTGNIFIDGKNYLIKVSGFIPNFRNLANIQKIFFKKSKNGNRIYLNDIIDVRFDMEEEKTATRFNKEKSTLLTVTKKKQDNLLEVYDSLLTEIEFIKKIHWYQNVEKNLYIDIFSFEANEMEKNIKIAQKTTLLSLVLIFIFLSFFMGIRFSFIIILSIPFCLMFSIMMLYITGRSINFVSQFAFNIVMGLVVDGAIVILESIKKNMDAGNNVYNASKKSLEEIGYAILTSSLTTIASFAPLFLVTGTVGEFLRIIPETVVFSMIAAIIFDHFFIPYLVYLIMSKENNFLSQNQNSFLSSRLPFIKSFRFPIIHYIHVFFVFFRKYVFRYPRTFLFLNSFFFVLSIFLLVFFVRKEFFPESSRPEFLLFFDAETQSGFQKVNNEIAKVEDTLMDYKKNSLQKEALIEKWYTYIGYGGFTGSIKKRIGAKKEGSAVIHVILDRQNFTQQNVKLKEFINQLKSNFNLSPWIKIYEVLPMPGPPRKNHLEIFIEGNQMTKLKNIGRQIYKLVLQEGSLKNIDVQDIAFSSLNIDLNIDREKLAYYGLSLKDINIFLSRIYNSSNFNLETYEYKGNSYKTRLRFYQEDKSNSLQNLLSLKIYSPKHQKKIPLKDIVKIEFQKAQNYFFRKNLKRTIQITINFQDHIPTFSKVKEIKNQIKNQITLPKDYNLSYEDETNELDNAVDKLTYSFYIAFILIYFIIALQFQSLTQPFLILLGIIFSFMGIILTLIITQTQFSISVMYAFISIIGIGVNDSIVLISYINQLLRNTKNNLSLRDAIEHGSIKKLRPVILTTITTISGVFPFLVIAGNELWVSFSWTIIGGLFFTTLQTLVLIPLLYKLEFQLKDWINKKRNERRLSS